MDSDRTSRRSSRELFAQPKPSNVTNSKISPFESILARYPPIFESLLLQLPTSSILHLYQTSRFLRSFVQRYPLAWKILSFRAISPGRIVSRQTSPASDTSADATMKQSKLHHLDQLLLNVVKPFGTRITSLTLDHTAVSGTALTQILNLRHETIAHLSIRGCKQVSLKYHIVPFLTMWHLQRTNGHTESGPHLALKSLYVFRCRHHRRRPYTVASLLRRDSDAQPTHELIKICHILQIWTDTGWCPTPGGRCLRRRDYSLGRGVPDSKTEVWVVFDRLWRSDNRLGASSAQKKIIETSGTSLTLDGRLWESSEFGIDGEPLGCEPEAGEGEGKATPTHLRRSHKMFVDTVNCHECKAPINERCEHCSVRMHCMGCRKTLCANCAFTRPLPAPAIGQTALLAEQSFWWAPGQRRNPNLLMQEIMPGTSNGGAPTSIMPPPLSVQWCCLKPQFSNGGGVTLVGPNMTQTVISHLKTAPLPQKSGYEDPEIMRLKRGSQQIEDSTKNGSEEVLNWMLYGPGSQDSNPCPRSLCKDCFGISGWKSNCHACQEPFCYAHDLRGLSIRVCGMKDLAIEKENTEDLAHADMFAALLANVRAEDHSAEDDGSTCQSIPSPDKTHPQFFQQELRSARGERDFATDRLEGELRKLSERNLVAILKDHISADEQNLPAPSSMVTWPPTISSELCKDIEILASEKQIFNPIPVRSESIRDKNINDDHTQVVSPSQPSEKEHSSTPEIIIQRHGPVPQPQTHLLDHQAEEVDEADKILSTKPIKPESTSGEQVAASLSMMAHKLQWNGCRALMCPKFRTVGDHRSKCAAVAQQCSLCKVHVCPSCLKINAPCDCAYCKNNYRCPRCSPFFAHLCKKEEELALAGAVRLAIQKEKEAALLEAEQAGEFLSMAFGNNDNG